MKLTDEERVIADRVAEKLVRRGYGNEFAWSRSLAHIAARREAFGEAEPAPATAAGVGDDVKAADQLQPGDYVLATKFDYGDPCEHFVVGYLANPPKLGRNSDRWMVVNDEGIPFRATGFRRAERITQDEGQAILAIMPQIANVEGPSLWEHLARIRREKVESPATAAGVGALPPEASDEAGAAAQAPPTFEDELADLINRHGIDSQHNTPDSVLSRFVMRVLEAHRLAAEHRSGEVPSFVAAPRGVVVTPLQRGVLVDVERFFQQRSEYNTSAAERHAAAVIARHVGDLLAASDWPNVMPDGTRVSAAVAAAD